MLYIPTKTIIETPRLLIRQYQEEDIQLLHEIFADAETMQYYPAPFRLRDTEEWMRRNWDRYRIDGFGLWAVCLKDTHEFIGDCGLVKHRIKGQIEVELGYHIRKDCWGKGYATEAALACKEYAFSMLGLSKIMSIIDPKNKASIRVAEKNKLAFEREEYIFNKTHVIYSCYKNEV